MSHELFELSDLQAQKRIWSLSQQVQVLTAILILQLTLLRLLAKKLNWEPSPNGATKETLLGAIQRACDVMPLGAALHILGLRRVEIKS